MSYLQPGGDEADAEGGEAEEEIIYTYIPPEPKEWVSQGSEKEIKEENVVENRRRVGMHIWGDLGYYIFACQVFAFKYKFCLVLCQWV